ncbi:hypothetical protein [Pontibacter liquoris]|nr:hypothetical protein [Pontibacter liquoris]
MPKDEAPRAWSAPKYKMKLDKYKTEEYKYLVSIAASIESIYSSY